MTYDRIKEICEFNKITVSDVAKELGMTSTGFRQSIVNQTLPIRFVLPLTKILCVSLNDFFDLQSNNQETIYGHNIQQSSGVKSKNIIFDSKATETLIEQLRIKDEQIKEKDSQIAKLFSMLPN